MANPDLSFDKFVDTDFSHWHLEAPTGKKERSAAGLALLPENRLKQSLAELRQQLASGKPDRVE